MSMQAANLSAHIWNSRYRHVADSGSAEQDISESWRRVAIAVAAVEDNQDCWRQSFEEVLSGFRFLPGGRILAGAGTGRHITLFNCFVMGNIADSIDRIFDSLKESALTMQQGGGIGCDFSTLRPAGSRALASGATASGPLSFMHLWDSMCEALLSTGTRRGAMMATLRCDHPDIEAFIDAKRSALALRNFNLSVLVTDRFMEAIANDSDWQLRFPPTAAGVIHRTLPAKQLWERILKAAHATADPGVLFIDRVNRENNLYYREHISATNPCGEIPLPPYGACNLGSLNLASFVRRPFTTNPELDKDDLRGAVIVATRFLDNVIDISRFPLELQAHEARSSRRVGLGITGLADMLVMLGLHYDSEAGRSTAARTMQLIRDEAYASSIDLAREKGTFASYDREKYLCAPFIRRLPELLRSKIADHGIRNSHLLAIAPAGTISLLAGNVSSGMEPIYALDADRTVRGRDLKMQNFALRDRAYAEWISNGNHNNELADYFVTADELSPRAHLEMQASLQPYVDNAISKTVNLPPDSTVDDIADVYQMANSLGLKGCTVFRSGALSGQVLRARGDKHCCDTEREAD